MSYELRPLTLAEILDAAFRLVQTEWRTLIGLSLLAQLPVVVLGLQAEWLFDPFAQPSFDPDMDAEALSSQMREELTRMGILFGVMSLIYLVLYPFVAAAVAAAVGHFYLGRRFELADAVRAGLRNLLRLVGAYLAWGLAYFGIMIVVFGGAALAIGAGTVLLRGVIEALGVAGIVLAVILGIAAFVVVVGALVFAGVVTSLLPPVAVLESVGVVATVSRAFELASSAKLRTMGVVLTAGLIVGFPVYGAQMMIGFVPYVGMLVWAVFLGVSFAFTSSVAVVLYFDLRCRAENYDVELLAQQVEAGPGARGG